MIIRNANQNDASMLKPLLLQLGYDELDVNGIKKKVITYSSPENAVLVAEIDAQVVGFISLHIFESFHSEGRVGRITAFCVDEKFRSHGLGFRLLQEGEKFFMDQGCRKIEVTSNNRRVAAHQFYLKRGYIEDSRKFVRYLD